MAWPTTSRHLRGYGKAHEQMRALLLRTVVLCEECTRQGRTTAGVIADHIVPLSRGGTGDRSNYQLLCRRCSDAKTAEEAADAQGRAAPRSRGVDAAGWPAA